MQEQPKNWQWPHDQIFEISGKTLELFLHLKNSILSNPESQKVIMALQLDELLQKVVEDGIKSGKITDGSKIPTELNHWYQLSKDPEQFRKLFGFGIIPSNEVGSLQEHEILDRGETIWMGDYWIPQAELKLLQELPENADAITFGYMEGLTHHLGDLASGGMYSSNNSPGYTMWIMYK